MQLEKLPYKQLLAKDEKNDKQSQDRHLTFLSLSRTEFSNAWYPAPTRLLIGGASGSTGSWALTEGLEVALCRGRTSNGFDRSPHTVPVAASCDENNAN